GPARPAGARVWGARTPFAIVPRSAGSARKPLNSAFSPAAEDHTSRQIMRCVLVCPDDFLWRLVADSGEPRLAPVFLVESARARMRIAQRGGEVLAGDLERDGLYRRAFRTGHEPLPAAGPRPRRARSVAAHPRAAPAPAS